MKVLLIHQHFKTPESGGAIRSWYLVQALIHAGMEVVVITATNGPRKTEHSDKCTIHYLSVPYDNAFSSVQRIGSFLKFMVQASSLALRQSDVNVVYAISTPLTTGCIALLLRYLKRIPFIFEVGDLWPEAPIQMGVIRNPGFKMTLYKLEKWIYRKANQIVALSDSMAIHIRQLTRTPVEVIPNMADTEFYKAEKIGVTHRFRVAYIGALGAANGLSYVVEAAYYLQLHNVEAEIILCGAGAKLQYLAEEISRRQLNRITLLPFRDRAGVREILRTADAILVTFLPLPVLQTGSPNKYFDGLAAGKPVLVNVAGWLTEEVQREEIGLALHPTDAASILQLKELMADPQRVQRMQHNARALAERTYSRKLLSARFVGLFNSIPERT